MLIENQTIKLNPPEPAELVACLFWRKKDVFVRRGSLGKVVRVITDNHVAVKFDNFEFELIVPTRYLL